jgi:hypothetical protein
MVTVALAGATSGFGLTMLRTFHHINNGKHKLVLLSRSAKPEWTAKGIDVRPVDHTLLSVIGGSIEAMRDSQLKLLTAAQEAGVRRFAPSEYAGQGYDGIDLYQPKAVVWEATRKSGLEYTCFSCGLFMSVFATGTPKPVTEVGKCEGAKTGEQEALAELRPWNFVINMKAGTADYPGDGNAKLVFTDMRDIATFVFHALDVPKWPAELGMQGDVKSFREAVSIAERVQKRKFLTRENSIEVMDAHMEDPRKRFYNQTRIAIAKGWFMVPDDLNKAFPEVKPVTCEQFIEKWWSGVELPGASWGEDASFM